MPNKERCVFSELSSSDYNTNESPTKSPNVVKFEQLLSQCIKNSNDHLIGITKYFFNESAWVEDILHLIIKRFDVEIGIRAGTALLLLDNASCHKIYTKFKNIRLEYLGANMTRYIQRGI